MPDTTLLLIVLPKPVKPYNLFILVYFAKRHRSHFPRSSSLECANWVLRSRARCSDTLNNRSFRRSCGCYGKPPCTELKMVRDPVYMHTVLIHPYLHSCGVQGMAHFTGRLQSGMTQLNLPPPQHGQSHLAPMSDQMESKQNLLPSIPQDNMGFDAQLMESSIDQLLNDSSYIDLDEA